MVLVGPPTQKVSVFVGKVVSTKAGDGGDDLELRWYMPRRVAANCTRSKYGRGKWTPEYVKEFGRLVPSVGVESVGAVAAKFSDFTAQGKLPSHVWGALSGNTLPSEEILWGRHGQNYVHDDGVVMDEAALTFPRRQGSVRSRAHAPSVLCKDLLLCPIIG